MDRRGGFVPEMRPSRVRDLWTTALALAFFTAVGELALLAYQRFVQHRPILLSYHFVWMTPTADAVLFGSVTGITVLWVLAAPGPRSYRLAVFLVSLLAAASLVTMFPRLSWWTQIVLALGIASVLTRLLDAPAPSLLRQLRRIGLGAAVVTASTALFMVGRDQIRERHARSASHPLSTPNVILLVWDTARAIDFDLYGYHRVTTPFLDTLATRGAQFTWAFTNAPWTLPSHASMFTGRFEHELEADFRTPFETRYPTLAEAMRSRGYLTAGFVGNTFYCGHELGLDRGFDHYEDYPLSPEEFVLSSALGRALTSSARLRRVTGDYDIFGRKSAATINRDFLSWADRVEGRPFFAFLNYFDPHEPYLSPEPFRSRFGAQGARQLERIDHRQLRNGTRWLRKLMKPEESQAELDAYDGGISYVDAQLRELVQALEARHLLRNTILVVTADHGEELGEHGHYSHGNDAYAVVTRVPLVIVAPHLTGKHVVDEPVSLRSLAQTIFDLSGVAPDGRFPGRTLRSTWERAPGAPVLPQDTVLTEHKDGGIRSIISGRFQYIQQRGHPEKSDSLHEELYDLVADMDERVNLISSPAGDSIAADIRGRFQQLFERPWVTRSMGKR